MVKCWLGFGAVWSSRVRGRSILTLTSSVLARMQFSRSRAGSENESPQYLPCKQLGNGYCSIDFNDTPSSAFHVVFFAVLQRGDIESGAPLWEKNPESNPRFTYLFQFTHSKNVKEKERWGNNEHTSNN